MALKRYGGIGSGEHLGSNLDFIVVHTVIDVAEGEASDVPAAVDNLVKFFDVVATGAQPVIVSVSTAEVDLSDATQAAAYALGTDFVAADTTVHSIRFAIEHGDTFGLIGETGDVTKPLSLAARLQGVKVPFVSNSIEQFELADVAKKNTSVVGYAVL